jgi:predicted TIM-barrel fold metal-dependent hydrolase
MPQRTIDAHIHLYDLERNPYTWLKAEPIPEIFDGFLGDITPIKQTYDVEHFLADAAPGNVVKSVCIEVGWDPADLAGETAWLQSRADEHGVPQGIVAGAELDDEGIGELLQEHCRHANIRGIREILNAHDDPAWDFSGRPALTNDPAWRRGFALLERHDLVFDLQIYPHQAADAAALARAFPGIQIVLDHAAMPIERDAAGLERWRAATDALAACPNVTAKISGLAMQDHDWTVDSIRPIVAGTLEAFGPDRCMWASNFPIDKLYTDYGTIVSAYETIAAELGLSAAEQDAFFYATAERVYRL